jgi:hypothetical protein
VLVIQIKPHIERLLNLRPDSLTKEIELGQYLMEMFVRYQIPSDLLSYDGDEAAEGRTRVDRVRANVQAIRDMLHRAKEEEGNEKVLQDRAMKGEEYQLPPGTGGVSLRSMPISNSTIIAAPCPPSMSARSMMMKSSFAPPPPMMSIRMESLTTLNPSGDDDYNEQRADEIMDGVGGGSSASSSAAHQSQQTGLDRADAADDYTALPARLDGAHDKYDPESALRSTIITPGEIWTRRSQKGLLREPTTSTLRAADLERERSSTFDLLDALSRSGSRVLEDASLHVLVASTHNFDRSLMDTVVRGNVNPIERVERSTLIIASTLHRCPTTQLLKGDQTARVQASSPSLFIADSHV